MSQACDNTRARSCGTKPFECLMGDLFQSMHMRALAAVCHSLFCMIRCSALLQNPVQPPKTSSVLPSLVWPTSPSRTPPTGSVATAHLHIGGAWAATPDSRHANSVANLKRSLLRQPTINPVIVLSPSRRDPPVPAPTKIAGMRKASWTSAEECSYLVSRLTLASTSDPARCRCLWNK